MSANSSTRQIAELLSGRWQIPVALAAVVAASAALYQLLPSQTTVELGGLLADVAALEAAGNTEDAADALGNLLDMEPPLPQEQQAELHDQLADLIYRRESRREQPNLDNLRLLLTHNDAALEMGCTPNAARSLRAARAADWLGNRARAVPSYREVLELGPAPEEQRLAAQGLVRLLGDTPNEVAERSRLLDELLADEGVSSGYLWWALQQTLQDAFDEGDAVRARLLLAKYGHRLATSDLKGYQEYLWAWVMMNEGRSEEAEPLVRWVDEWLDRGPRDDDDLRSFGSLPAMNRWLLGRVHLAQHRPQDAIDAFDEAMALSPRGQLAVAAAAGKADALAELERHETAQRAYREALARLADVPSEKRRGEEQLRKSLLGLYERLKAQGDDANASVYLAMGLELTPKDAKDERLELLDKLGQSCQRAAEQVTDDQRRRSYRGQAGEYLEQAAELSTSDEERYAALLWSAAQEYDQAGQMAGMRRVLTRFIKGRSNDPRLPRALLLMGQAHEADGRFEEALTWYHRLSEQYPKLEEAYRGSFYGAGCLRALDREAEAEVTLRELLDDDRITPQAAVFHDVLLELCDLLYQQGRYGEAIGRLEDFATLYPDDPARYRSRFMLADAYRRSADALRADPPQDVDAARVDAACRERLARAAELFDDLLCDLSGESDTDETLAAYERLGLFYRADCLFALNEPDALQQALEAYQRAAARYEHQPAALTAQVQIANVYLRLGLVSEAARAVERARWLLPGIPDSAFETCEDGADRAHWDRYLTAISSSELFQGAFADGR